MFKDYYSILNVSPCASGEDIRRAFKDLALRYHPDRAQSSSVEGAHDKPSNAASSSSSPPASSLLETKANTMASFSCADTGMVTLLSNPHVRNFTDIQEAYEVLGNVARRYMYDMNYHEALLQQEHQRQEELARREAHLRAVEEAMRHARECERRRQLRAQGTNQTRQAASPSASSPPISLPAASSSSIADKNHSSASAAIASSLIELPLISGGKKGVQSGMKSLTATTPVIPTLDGFDAPRRDNSNATSGGNGGVVNGFITPSLNSTQRHHRKSRGRGRSDFSCSVSDLNAFARSRLLLRRQQHTLQPRKSLSAPSTFLVTNSLTLAAESTSATNRSVSTRAAGGRPGSLRDSDAELPLEYYHQRSIERTLRIFFGTTKAVQ